MRSELDIPFTLPFFLVWSMCCPPDDGFGSFFLFFLRIHTLSTSYPNLSVFFFCAIEALSTWIPRLSIFLKAFLDISEFLISLWLPGQTWLDQDTSRYHQTQKQTILPPLLRSHFELGKALPFFLGHRHSPKVLPYRSLDKQCRAANAARPHLAGLRPCTLGWEEDFH